MAHETRRFENMGDITPEDVAWLKEGSYKRGGYVYNSRRIDYMTKRGVCKSMTCYVMNDGTMKWRSMTSRGNTSDGLTTEEARVFAPEIAAMRDERNAACRKRRADALEGANVTVGSVFAGTWGYEAQLWDFYEVTRVSASGKTMWVRHLKKEGTHYGNCCEGSCRPKLHDFNGKEERHTLKVYGGVPYFRVNSYCDASLITDVERYRTEYNYH